MTAENSFKTERSPITSSERRLPRAIVIFAVGMLALSACVAEAEEQSVLQDVCIEIKSGQQLPCERPAVIMEPADNGYTILLGTTESGAQPDVVGVFPFEALGADGHYHHWMVNVITLNGRTWLLAVDENDIQNYVLSDQGIAGYRFQLGDVQSNPTQPHLLRLDSLDQDIAITFNFLSGEITAEVNAIEIIPTFLPNSNA